MSVHACSNQTRSAVHLVLFARLVRSAERGVYTVSDSYNALLLPLQYASQLDPTTCCADYTLHAAANNVSIANRQYLKKNRTGSRKPSGVMKCKKLHPDSIRADLHKGCCENRCTGNFTANEVALLRG